MSFNFFYELYVFLKDFYIWIWAILAVVFAAIGALVHFALKDPEKDDFRRLKGFVENQTPHQILYEKLLGWFLGAADRFFEPGRDDKTGSDPQKTALTVPFAWSASSYDRSLLLAVMYPVGAAIFWVGAGWIRW